MIFCQRKCKTSACHRRKLLVLINDSDHRIREHGTLHAVDDNSSHCYLPGIRLVARLAVNQIGKKISVPVRKSDFGDICSSSCFS